jgi:phosphatidylinositol kinase/protein kinase (PI-3  family)
MVFILKNDFFLGHILHEMNRHCVAAYLAHDVPSVRKAAVTTCCRLLSCDNIREQTSEHAIQVTVAILDKLMNTAVCDPGIYRHYFSGLCCQSPIRSGN